VTPKAPRRKCAMPNCHRHVHGLSAARGVLHCRPCVMAFRYAFRVARERDVGTEVGHALAKFYATPNNQEAP
jgi:hypothetical protein